MPSQIIQLPFTGGIAQKVAQEYVDPSTALLDVVNGVYTKDGGVDKRLGIAALSNAQLPGDPTMGPVLKLLSRGATRKPDRPQCADARHQRHSEHAEVECHPRGTQGGHHVEHEGEGK